jgi:hypothetical protein
MPLPALQLPACGMFIGSGVYPTSADYLLCTLHAHQSWAPQDTTPDEMIQKIIDDNQGNLAQLWGSTRGYAPATFDQWFYALDELGIHIPKPDWTTGDYTRPQTCQEFKTHADRFGAGILRFIHAAAQKGIYTALLYTDARPQWSVQFQQASPWYLGYDFGERFTFRFEESANPGKSLKDLTLASLADDLVARVKAHVDQRRATGWGPIMATSINFYIDYEVLAGVDIPVIEDFAFSHLNMASALSRGLMRQHDLPLWGSHLAHEHYSWIPNAHPRKFDLLTAGLYQKYIAGCKMVINESGNWHVEASLCEDSPKFDFPKVPIKPSDISWGGEKSVDFSAHIPEARKHYHKIDYHSPICRSYRKVISDFYDFVKANPAPQGQPETTIALAKGNLDLCSHRFSPIAAVAGAYSLADLNPNWLEGAPEQGWEIAKRVFYPLMPVLEPCPNRFLSGSPHGMVDVVSFAGDRITADFLTRQYKALLFTGWNTASTAQYQTLKSFVSEGGTLFIALPHLSADITRNHTGFTTADLLFNGDFSDLCGIKVLSKGKRIYWATAPVPNGDSPLGFSFPRRFGIIGACLGNLQITDPAVQTLVVDDEQAAPVLLRRNLGKGTVYFLNTWAYPGAVNTDEGPGARTDSLGLVGTIYRHIALQNRPAVYITDDQITPGPQCKYITFSHFPQSKTICLLNIDFDQPHSFYLHQPNSVTPVTLAGGQFQLITTSKD